MHVHPLNTGALHHFHYRYICFKKKFNGAEHILNFLTLSSQTLYIISMWKDYVSHLVNFRVLSYKVTNVVLNITSSGMFAGYD